jgi:hypothetical protein
MEKETALMSRLAGHSKEYLRLEAEALRLQVYRKLSDALSAATFYLVVAAVFCFFLFFAAGALAFYIGEKTGSIKTGFLAVSGIFMLGGITLLLSRHAIRRGSLRNAIAASVSGMPDYASITANEQRVQSQIASVNTAINADLDELRTAADKVNSEVNRVRGLLNPGEQQNGKGKLLYTVLDVALNKFLLKRAGIVPVIVESALPGGALHTVGKSAAQKVSGWLFRKRT